jgi:hypothetical protein
MSYIHVQKETTPTELSLYTSFVSMQRKKGDY